MDFDSELAWKILPNLLEGAAITLALILPPLILGMIISIPMALARLSSNLFFSGPAWAFTTFFRGAPAIILLYLIYNGFAQLSYVRETFLWYIFAEPYYCAVIAFTMNHSGYLTEVLRGAFQAVPSGLILASRSLGLSKPQTFFLMTMPMAMRLGLSAYQNEVILFAKGTAAVSAITLMDLLAVANETVSTTYDPFTPLVVAAAIYWLFVQIILISFARLEAHLNRHLRLAM